MPTPRQGSRLDGSASHQKKILANLTKQLIEHDKTKTTDTKTRLLHLHVEELITRTKHDTLADRRNVAKLLNDNYAVKKLFDEIGLQFVGHDGGYTHIIRLGNRKGGNAPISLITLVEEETAATEATRATRAIASEQAEGTKAEEAEAEAAEEE